MTAKKLQNVIISIEDKQALVIESRELFDPFPNCTLIICALANKTFGHFFSFSPEKLVFFPILTFIHEKFMKSLL